MKNKRGQFYIILAIIIIVIVAGLVTTENWARKLKEPVKFYDLSEDYEAETTKIIDYGVFTQETDIESEIEGFTSEFLDYAQEKDPNLGLIYIYGNKNEIIVDNYALEGGKIVVEGGEYDIEGGAEKVTSKISIQYGNKTFVRDVEEKMRQFIDVKKDIVGAGEWIEVELAGTLYSFDLKSGEAFYYVIATEGDEKEIHIVKEGETEGTT